MQLNHLLVSKLGSIVNQSEGMIGVAVCTEYRLRNTASVNLHRGCVSADIALKEGLPHLWDQGASPDHHSTDSDKLINVCLTSQHDITYTQIIAMIAVMKNLAHIIHRYHEKFLMGEKNSPYLQDLETSYFWCDQRSLVELESDAQVLCQETSQKTFH